MTDQDLYSIINRIDGRQYPAYKDIKGRYHFDQFSLSIDRVQGDPFAAPSRLSIEIPHNNSGLPSDLFSNLSRRTGTENFLALAFSRACRKNQSHQGSGKSGLLAIDTPGQEILERTCVEIDATQTIIRFTAGLPASGRRILGRAANMLLVETLPQIVSQSLFYSNINAKEILSFANANEDATHLRNGLASQKLVAFVANGATLPRESGISQKPLAKATSFQSPDSLEVAFDLPHAGTIKGMGIPEGITLIIGGGYHGKSTLLNAIERGVYNHIPGDGREQVVSVHDATKIRAEDGRAITRVDLSPFINNLPGNKSTKRFTSENASGSTSQAANIVEALETGTRALLLDEDISATNFLIRDSRMQQLISAEKEPITPFVKCVRPLFEEHGISTVIVLGGSGDYFDPAHRIVAMDNYLPKDLTADAKAICADSPELHSSSDQSPNLESLADAQKRFADPSSIYPYKKATPYRGSHRGRSPIERAPRKHIKAHDTRSLTFGTEEIDVALISQIVAPSQLRTIGAVLAFASDSESFQSRSIVDALAELIQRIEQEGLSFLKGDDLASIRLQEVAGALNRLRSLRIRE